jgi:WD40 repeat protein
MLDGELRQATVNHIAAQGWLLAAGSSAGWVSTWDVRHPSDGTSPLVGYHSMHNNTVTGLALDGDRVLSCSLSGNVALSSSLEHNERGSVMSHQLGVSCMAYSTQQLFTAGLAADARQGWSTRVCAYPTR